MSDLLIFFKTSIDKTMNYWYHLYVSTTSSHMYTNEVDALKERKQFACSSKLPRESCMTFFKHSFLSLNTHVVFFFVKTNGNRWFDQKPTVDAVYAFFSIFRQCFSL